jgi:hypothetical protein
MVPDDSRRFQKPCELREMAWLSLHVTRSYFIRSGLDISKAHKIGCAAC